VHLQNILEFDNYEGRSSKLPLLFNNDNKCLSQIIHNTELTFRIAHIKLRLYFMWLGNRLTHQEININPIRPQRKEMTMILMVLLDFRDFEVD
jgi:hypothetical protein